MDVLVFVKFIRGKIEGYIAFGHEMLKYLDKHKRAHPELTDFLKEMEERTREMDAAYARRREKIKTPAYVAELCNKFRATLIDYDGADALAKCKAITKAIVVVGGSQDELVGECRMAVKRLRQGAALAMARDPRVTKIATEIRQRTRPMLRNAAGHEGARH